MAEQTYHEAVGRRKQSTARARIYPGGSGSIMVNNLPAAEYFPRLGDLDKVNDPLLLTGNDGTLDVTVRVSGGGITGQADATRHALARALLKLNPDSRQALRQARLLTRDARVKERKKPGLKRARKAPTYTKR